MKKVLLAGVLGFSIFANATDVLANETDASWTKQSGQWYLYEKSGQKVTGWKKVDGTWYYFGVDGVMATGWKMIAGTWYYFGTNGAMATDWKEVGGVWYYFGTNGAMVTDWKYIWGSWYYFGTDGAMATGWKYIGNAWYYFGDEGGMYTGLHTIEGEEYYFDQSGAMQYDGSGVDLQKLVQTAFSEGKLGPFSYRAIGKTSDEMEQEYGEPNIWEIGDCTECDAPHRAWYGSYMLNMKMPLDGNSPILYNIELSVYTPVETVKSWIGEPDEVEYGMDSIEMVYKRGEYHLVVRYNENTVYFISLYRNGYW